jgi:hypothetical protein
VHGSDCLNAGLSGCTKYVGDPVSMLAAEREVSQQQGGVEEGRAC